MKNQIKKLLNLAAFDLQNNEIDKEQEKKLKNLINEFEENVKEILKNKQNGNI